MLVIGIILLVFGYFLLRIERYLDSIDSSAAAIAALVIRREAIKDGLTEKELAELFKEIKKL